MNKQNLQKMIDEKYISVQKHPSEDLYIYNYTQKAQFNRMWNEETMNCRGLILDGQGNVVARPFSKFFNLQEAIDQGEQLPLEDFVLQEKYDGSLGILYWVGDSPFLATRGSFTSDQAIVGTALLQKYSTTFDELNRDYTYLFEIIYPENRIVVDYKGRKDVVLLAVIDTKTGKELDLFENYNRFPFAPYIAGIDDYNTLKERAEDNKEGFVIRFASNKRYKVKFDEYVRLHRLITGVNAKTIWELLRAGQSFEELMERVPDEFYEWVKTTKRKLEEEFALLEKSAKAHREIIRTLPTRKDQAISVQKHAPKLSSVIYRMLDKQPYADIIWKMIRPRADKPWKEDVDA